MSDYLFKYHAVELTTWVYLSSLLMIGLFFKFGRFWSVRNLDLILLILLAPGLLMVHYGQEQQRKLVNQTIDQEAESPGSAPNTDALAADEDAEGDSQSERNELSEAQVLEVIGFMWLFGAGGLLLTRLLLDPTMVRRPLLEPNLSLGGLTFIGCALFIFLMANVMAEEV